MVERQMKDRYASASAALVELGARMGGVFRASWIGSVVEHDDQRCLVQSRRDGAHFVETIPSHL